MVEEICYRKHYIAFLDILGFKDLIKTKECEEIYRLFKDRFKKPLDALYCDDTPVLDMAEVRMKVMSDSICFYVDASVENSLVGLVATCRYFQSDLLGLRKPILVRGAIAYGDLYADDKSDILFGQGLVDAYLMEENNAKNPRIIICGDTLRRGKYGTAHDNRDYIPNRIYRDSDGFYVIDYFEEFEGSDDKRGSKCRRLLKHIDSVLDTTTNDSIREKYIYVRRNLLRWYDPR